MPPNNGPVLQFGTITLKKTLPKIAPKLAATFFQQPKVDALQHSSTGLNHKW